MEQQYSLSRRTFLAGSAVAAATAGLALSGCGSSSSLHRPFAECHSASPGLFR